MVPSLSFPAGQLVQSEFVGPEQVAHSAWQLSHVLVAAFGYFQVGQVKGHAEASKYLVPVHVRHCVADAPLQVAHVASHRMHPFPLGDGFLNLLEGQVVTHYAAFRYLTPEQERQSVLRGPLQVVHSLWQFSQALVVLFPNCEELEQEATHDDPSRKVSVLQLTQWVARPPMQPLQAALQASHLLRLVFS